MAQQNTIDQLMKLVGQALQVASDEPFDPDTIDSGLLSRLDSLVLVALVGLVERELGVTIDDEEITPENFRTIEDLANLIESKSPV